MLKRRIRGKKNDNGCDLPMQIRTNGWEIPTNDDVLDLIDAIFENEDRIYPRPKFKGSGMFLDEILLRYAEYVKKTKSENNNLKKNRGLDNWM